MSADKNSKKIYLRIFWAVVLTPLVLITLLFVLISGGKLGPLPTFEKLENPENNLASEIYTVDSVLLGKFFVENRTFVEYEDLSPYLVRALLATEDIRFEKHSGIDSRGLARVIFRTIIGGQNTGGGSTITQQLAKNLFNTRENQRKSKIARSIDLVIIKFKEWNTAVRLERHYTKKEILVMYLNTVPFGQESFGIKSAASTFFNTTPDSLKIEEAAVLVGLLKAPTTFNPIRNPENSIQRRNVVLSQMEKYDFIDSQFHDSVSALPIQTFYNIQGHAAGLATHFRTFLSLSLRATKPIKEQYYSLDNYIEDSTRWETDPIYGWVNKNLKPDGTPYNIYTDGLKIYTTIDNRLQNYAEQAVNKHVGELLQKEFFLEKKGRKYAPFSSDLKPEEINDIMETAMKRTERYRNLREYGIQMDSIKKIFKTPRNMRVFTWNGEVDTLMSPMDSIRYYKHFLRAGFMAMEPGTGHVKAYMGGHNFKYFKYDQVNQGKRQVGSTVKPFLYTLAMQVGYSPCHPVANIPVTFPDRDSTWTPRNSGNFDMEGKMVTLEWGLAHSVNYISAWLVKQFHPQAVVDLMHKMGVKSKIDAVYSVIYGTSDIKLSEMVGAFNTYSSKGIYVEPVFVTKIEDRHGNEISSFQTRRTEAISEKTAYLTIQLLKNVVNRGTAGRLRWFFNFTGELGGKTGTTQNQSDGWYMGLAPNLTTGIWVGAEDRSVHFDNLGKGSGSYMALTIYVYFMQKVYAD
jgi:penicillin-binding protein 1A